MMYRFEDEKYCVWKLPQDERYCYNCSLGNFGLDRRKVPSRFMRKIVCRLRLNEVSRQ